LKGRKETRTSTQYKKRIAKSGNPGIKIDKVLLTIPEVAEIFNLSKFTVYRMLKDGEIQATKIRGSIRIFGSSLERYISDNIITQ
jgi:excisionase family DNA binding protein